MTPQPQPYGSPQPFYGQPSFVPPSNQVSGFGGQEANNSAPTPFVPKNKAYKKDKPTSGKNRKEKTEKKYSPKKTNKPAAETQAQQ